MTERKEAWPEVETAKVCACLDRILASPLFTQSERQQRFLKFIVTETLAGHTDRLKGYTIGVEVFDRDPSFDPAIDSIVRVEAARLRAKLREYYDTEGRTDPLRFDLPKGSYAIHIDRREPSSPLAEPLTPQSSGVSYNAGVGVAATARVRPIEDKPSIAVLPFDNMSNDPEQEYFSDGITEDLIIDLCKISGLFVVGRKSSFVYKQKTPVDLRTVGTELGVKFLLEGSVRKAGERIRVTAELIEAGSGHDLWAEHYDRALHDIFAVQDEITTSIVQALEVKLTRKEAALISVRPTNNMVAYDMCLRARELFLQFTRDAVTEAERIFQQIIEMEPNYSDAYALLSHVHIYKYISGWTPYRLETLDHSLRLAQRALELDEQSPAAHRALGWVLIWRRQPAEGVREVRKSLELSPNYDDARTTLSFGLSAQGEGEEALRYANEAIQHTPNFPVWYLHPVGCAQLTLEQYEECRVTQLHCRDMNPYFLPLYMVLVAACMELGRVEEARECVKELRRLSPDYVLGVSNIWLPETKTHQLINNHLRTLGFREAV